MSKIYLSWEETDLTVAFVDILVIVIDGYANLYLMTDISVIYDQTF